MHAAAAAAAAGQRDVERLLGEARGELRVGERARRASSAASIFCLAALNRARRRLLLLDGEPLRDWNAVSSPALPR